MRKKIKPEWLHLYPGAFWHDDGAIVGTREGLAELRDALEIALRDGNAVASAFVNDGEGYCIYVHQVSDEDMEKMALPYTDEMATESEDSDALLPHQLEHRADEAYREKFLRPNELLAVTGLEEQMEGKEKELKYPHERYSDEWDRAAGRLAMSYSPEIKACRDCGAPCINGYCCTFCGSPNP